MAEILAPKAAAEAPEETPEQEQARVLREAQGYDLQRQEDEDGETK